MRQILLSDPIIHVS